jgi:hypothetical protein
MDLIPSAFGCSAESDSQVRRGGYICRKLQQVFHWKVTRTTGYVLHCNQLDNQFSFQNLRSHRCVRYPCDKEKPTWV